MSNHGGTNAGKRQSSSSSSSSSSKKSHGTGKRDAPPPPISPTLTDESFGQRDEDYEDAQLDMDNLDELVVSTNVELSAVKRKPTPSEHATDNQHEARRSESRLNQVQAATVRKLAPIYEMPDRIGPQMTVYGLAKNLDKLAVLAAATEESTFVEVNFYIVDLNIPKQLEFYKKNNRRLAVRAQADANIGLQSAFRVGPLCFRYGVLRPMGILGGMSQPKEGVPRFAMRNQLMYLGPTVKVEDETPASYKGPDGKTKHVIPYSATATRSLEDLKTTIKHLFGRVYDGDAYGTTKLRQVCLVEVLTEMSREQPGSTLNIPIEAAQTLHDDVDAMATLTLASGQTLTIEDAEVKKRVRDRFIHKGVAPFHLDTKNEALRKSTHWSAPGTLLLARRKVFRRMNEDEEKQAKAIAPGETRPIWGSWPADRPEPTKEDFDDPSKTAECTWYANSKGYVTTPIDYLDQNRRKYKIPPETLRTEEESDSTATNNNDNAAGASEFSASTSPTAPEDGAPMAFVYKRPKYEERVLTETSIIVAELRLRFWCNKPSSTNPTGSYGVHVDFAPRIHMIERRKSDGTSGNFNLIDAFSTTLSPEELAQMYAENPAEFVHMSE